MARGVRNWMWAEALQLLDQAERVHRAMFRPGRRGRARPAGSRRSTCSRPTASCGSRWPCRALRPDQLEVRIEGDALVVAGERTAADCRAAPA